MTDAQEPLFPAGRPVKPLRPLTERQAAIYRIICEQPDGIEAIELGAILHSNAGRHAPDEFCEWCGQDGSRTLKEKAIRRRLVKRGAVYMPAIAADWVGRERPPSSQLEVLPGETFEDLFEIRDDAA